ncbi:MAG: hypothetical protein K6G54_03160, partial [Oscillospiraceae bacterium]|nr:hypothetical protein [Oscillospiraceae bacterium]
VDATYFKVRENGENAVADNRPAPPAEISLPSLGASPLAQSGKFRFALLKMPTLCPKGIYTQIWT